MLDHFGLVVKDLNQATAFYENALASLGFEITERHDYGAIILTQVKEASRPFIWLGTAQPDFWKPFHQASQSPLHLCFKAGSKEAVEMFYEAALKNGGTDNGKPGDRGRGYYAAYVIDPDGNNIEASFRS